MIVATLRDSYISWNTSCYDYHKLGQYVKCSKTRDLYVARVIKDYFKKILTYKVCIVLNALLIYVIERGTLVWLKHYK